MTPVFRIPRWLRCCALLAAATVATSAPAQIGSSVGTVVTTEQVRAELMAHAPDGADAGKQVWVGLQLAHQPEWHTYWKNSGDSGLPTDLRWTLPEGVTAGEIAWPTPRKIPIGNLANYGYEGTVLLPVPLNITPAFKPSLFSGDLEVRLKAAWLVCKQECIPEEGEFVLKIPVRSSTAAQGTVFAAAFAAQPRPLAAGNGSTLSIDQRSIKVELRGLPAELRGKSLEFFPETPEVIEPAGNWSQAWVGDHWTAVVPLSAHRSNSPTTMPVVVAAGDTSYRAELKVVGAWLKVDAGAGPLAASIAPGASSGGTAKPSVPEGAPLGFWLALLGALLGGLILNLMPCVFPVLAIKVFGFARHAEDRRAHRASGLAYTAGVLLSFLALGGLMLVLRSAGENLGWGFQLQNPAVVAGLAMLISVIGLNMAGLFELGRVLPSRLASLQLQHPGADAFLTGMLAVAVAAPCTAPFMGASLGLALGLPAVQALSIFAALGAGLALPLLIASLVPAFSRMLPQPGPWMDVLKKFMAFPMFITVAWLVWVLGQQSGIDGAGALLALLVAISAVVWASTLAGRARVLVGSLSLATLLVLAWNVGPFLTRPAEPVALRAESGWQPWEPGRVEQIVAGGRPVLVDFTAAWCVTCQYNKQTTLSNPEVLAGLAKKNVVLLRADWTRRDPAITAAMRQLGRNGVPVYAVYQGGRSPILMSEILTVQEVRSVLARL